MLKTLLYFLIFILLFSQGLLELSGISGAYAKFAAEFLILGLFIEKPIASLQGSARMIFPGLKYALLLGIVIIFSAVLNGKSLIEITLFTKTVYVYYLLFIALVNEKFNQREIERFYSFFKAIFIVQLIAVGIKFLFLGISESGGIGTISLTSGSLSTVLPMFASSYLLGMYFYTKKYKYIVGVLCFVFFGIIGSKRAILFFIPATFFIVQILFQTRRKSIVTLFKQKSFVKNFALLFFATIIAVYSIIRLNPTLNPDHEVGGQFNLTYALDYSQAYATRDKSNPYGVGRTIAPLLAFNTVANFGISHLFIGMGPGDILESAFLPGNYQGRNFKLLDKYGIGYGGRSGVIWLFMQVGLLGVILFFLIPIRMYNRVKKIYKKSSSPKFLQALALGFLGSVFVYFIDLGIYSRTMITQTAIVSVFFAMPALLIRQHKLLKKDQDKD